MFSKIISFKFTMFSLTMHFSIVSLENFFLGKSQFWINRIIGLTVYDLYQFLCDGIIFHTIHLKYRSGMLNSNTVNSKFHLIQSFFEIFARFLLFHV